MKKPDANPAGVNKPSPFIQKIKDIPVTPDDMQVYQQALARMSPAQRFDPTRRMIGILWAFGLMDHPALLDGHPTDLDHRAHKVAAVQARFEAFGELVDLETLRAYRVAAGSSDDLVIKEDYLQVAATAPLVDAPDGALHFDADDFVQRMLAHTQVKGTG